MIFVDYAKIKIHTPMKKLFFVLFLLIGFLISNSIFAQAPPSTNTNQKVVKNPELEKFTDVFCECINESLKDVHPLIITFFEETIKLGEEKATDNLVTSFLALNAEETEKVERDLLILSNYDSIYEEDCSEAFDLEKQIDVTAIDNYENVILKILESKDECKLAKTFFQMGMMEEGN